MTILSEEADPRHSTEENADEGYTMKTMGTGGMKNEGGLYNKYAYDYLYTREGEEERGWKTRVGKESLEGTRWEKYLNVDY